MTAIRPWGLFPSGKSPVENRLRRGMPCELSLHHHRLNRIPQLSGSLRVIVSLQQRMAVMGNGDIVVGRYPPAQKSASVSPEKPAKRAGAQPAATSEER